MAKRLSQILPEIEAAVGGQNGLPEVFSKWRHIDKWLELGEAMPVMFVDPVDNEPSGSDGPPDVQRVRPMIGAAQVDFWIYIDDKGSSARIEHEIVRLSEVFEDTLRAHAQTRPGYNCWTAAVRFGTSHDGRASGARINVNVDGYQK